jgi:hypothetical protein
MCSLTRVLYILVSLWTISPALCLESDDSIRVKEIIINRATAEKLMHTKIGIITESQGIYDLTDIFKNLGAIILSGESVNLYLKECKLVVRNSNDQINLITELLNSNFVKRNTAEQGAAANP